MRGKKFWCRIFFVTRVGVHLFYDRVLANRMWAGPSASYTYMQASKILLYLFIRILLCLLFALFTIKGYCLTFDLSNRRLTP